MSQHENLVVTVPASGLTEIAAIKNIDKSILCFHFDVSGQALDDFDVLVKANEGASSQDLTPASWTTLVQGGRFLHSSGNLAAIPASGNGYFEMDVYGLVEIVIKASAASDSASVKPRWSLS